MNKKKMDILTNEEALKDKLSPCREIFPILLDVFIWKKDIYPCILTGLITFLFGMLWYLNPSVITALAVFGLSVTLADFFLPAISQTVVSNADWDSDKEKKFSIFCNRIAYYSVQIWNFSIQIEEWKQDTPNLYASFVICSLLTLAWIGNAVNNLILLYLLVLFLALLPGLLQRRILQTLFAKIVLSTANVLGLKRKSN